MYYCAIAAKGVLGMAHVCIEQSGTVHRPPSIVLGLPPRRPCVRTYLQPDWTLSRNSLRNYRVRSYNDDTIAVET